MKNILAGAGGAVALNILHESLKKMNPDMPHVDLLGEEALQKTLHCFGGHIDDPDNLYRATLAGDLVSNTLYYSMIGKGSKNTFTKAVVLGLAAGIGAIALPKPMGLDPEPVTRSTQTKVLTVGYYLAGALVTAAIVKALKK
jgi:hypothetical protein